MKEEDKATSGKKGARATTTPSWAWWTRPSEILRLRHATRTLGTAAALEGRVFGGGPPLDRVLREYQRAHRSMGRNDRLVLGTAVYGLARNRELYRRVLEGYPVGEGSYLLLALLDATGAPPGTVPHLPDGVRPWTAALDRAGRLRSDWAATLERGRNQPVATCPPDIQECLAGLFSVPWWWVEVGPWTQLAGALDELGVLKKPQDLILRVQAPFMGREEALAALEENGIPCAASPRSPWGIRVEGRHNVLATRLFRQGAVEVQDEGSQLVACLCDPKPGETVLDLCAGGGGKTLALAAGMQGRGTVVAYDADPRRLTDTRRRARKGGLGNVRVLEERDRVVGLGPYDLVLADVPCTSSGTLRRNPDVAWRWGRVDLERLVATQAEILETAASLVRPGGHLAYVTCSLLAAENTSQIERFLERHGEFTPAPLGDRRGHAPLLDVPGADSGIFRLAANLDRYDGDAFFLARLRRAS